eukprot:TRINITY_DN11014_c0_g1_i1.p2 TRINITY_DN11014_c0_g1~~TRINITY_DN11014_c0_g1_i1.p2  ORF type:complete len:287 (+),score=60.73 TRINITY_DN11014_c0_g1_i1:58-861(+)
MPSALENCGDSRPQPPPLRLQNATLGQGGDAAKAVVEGLDFEVRPGQIVMVTGESGCGKSTLLRALAGLDLVPEGKLCLGDKEFASGMPAADWRCRVAYNVQTPPTAPGFSDSPAALAAQMEGFAATKRWKAGRKSISDVARAIVDEWEMDKSAEDDEEFISLFDRPWREASGGQRQRLVLALTLSRESDYLLLDEPTSALDIVNTQRVEQTMKAFAEQGRGIVWVTHSQEQAERMMTSAEDRLHIPERGQWLRGGKRICSGPNKVA